MTTNYLSGYAFVKKVGDQINVFEPNPGSADNLPVVAEGSNTPRTLKDRFADVVNVKDFGAVGDGVTDDTAAIQKALDHGGAIYVPAGVYSISGELSITKAGTRILGAGRGGGYSGNPLDMVTGWSHVTTFLFVENSQLNRKRRRTRFLARTSISDAMDPELSVGMNVQAENVHISDLCLYLDISLPSDYYDTGVSYRGVVSQLTNKGVDLDVGVFVGSRCQFSMSRVAVIGYWRKAGIWADSTQTNTLPRFTDQHGNYYPKSNVENGGDGFRLDDVTVYGGRWGLRIQGPMPVGNKGSVYPDYYFDYDGTKVPDNRGTYGFSDILLTGCTIYGYNHFTRIAWDYFDSKDDPTEFETAEKYGGSLFIAGLSGAGAIQGHRYIGTRFGRGAGYGIYLGITGNDTFIGCVSDKETRYNESGYIIESSEENEYGGLIVTNDIYHTSFIGCAIYDTYEYWLPYSSRYSKNINWLCGNEGATENYSKLNDTVLIGNFDPNFFDSMRDGSVRISTKAGSASGISFDSVSSDGLNKNVAALRYFDASSPEFRLSVGEEKLFSFTLQSGTALLTANASRAFGIVLSSNQTLRVRDSSSSDKFLIGTDSSGNYGIRLGGNSFPTKSNTYSLGQAANLWSQVYAGSETISTSDAREKMSITDPEEALMRAWGKVGFKVFQFRDAVEKKGSEARLHVGVIAQEVIAAFASEGLDATRYGLLCHDEWDDEYEDVEVIDEPGSTDADGNVTPAKTHIEHRLITPAGDRYGIRYGEALALECAYQRWRLDRLEAAS